MGFFERDVWNPLDSMFDWNKDGKLDVGEEMMEFMFLEDISKQEEEKKQNNNFNKWKN